MIFVLEGRGGSFKDWSSQGSLKRGVKVCFWGGKENSVKT